jgi:hypothetical protein
MSAVEPPDVERDAREDGSNDEGTASQAASAPMVEEPVEATGSAPAARTPRGSGARALRPRTVLGALAGLLLVLHRSRDLVRLCSPKVGHPHPPDLMHPIPT